MKLASNAALVRANPGYVSDHVDMIFLIGFSKKPTP